MKVKVIGFNYKQSETKNFQGTKRKLKKEEEKGFIKIRGGNGSYVLSKPSVAEVVLNIDGETETFDVKDLIREYYDMKKVTEKSFETFRDDVKKGNKKLLINQSNYSLSMK